MKERLVTCVLGMHRSGTSLTTSLLRLLDIELGPEEHLLAPDLDNPAGFWEHRAITRLNDELLTAFGGTWCQPPALPAGWESCPSLAQLRRRARAAVARDFGSTSRWAWKDPRTCITLPFWRELVAPTHYVLCIRNPVDVATSLHRRSPEAISLTAGAELWVTYVEAALRETASDRRLVIFYDDLMLSPRHAFEGLADFVGRPSAASAQRTRKLLRRMIREDLWHHRTPDDSVVDDDRIPFAAKALYLVLRLANANRGRDTPRLETLAAHALGAVADGARQRSSAAEFGRALTELERARREQAATAGLREELATEQARVRELDSALTEALAARNEIGEVRRAIGDLAHRFGGQAELLGSVSEQVDKTLETTRATRQLAYEALVARFLGAVDEIVPDSATVAVVSRGDHRLLELGRRHAMHFPRTPDGQYAGHYPTSGDDAVEQLERVRSAGAEYLVFPSTAFWWLDHYAELRSHLDSTYRRAASRESCLVFDLRSERAGGRLRRLATAIRERHAVEPARNAVITEDALESSRPEPVAQASAQAALAAMIRASCSDPMRRGPSVSIVILNRDGAHHLQRCFAGLQGTDYDPYEVVVVDNGSTDGSLALLEEAAATLPLRVLRNDGNRSFSSANNQGALAATGELLLFLNNDTEPIGPGWLGRLVRTLVDDGAAGVGARLVYPERPGLNNEGDIRFADLTLQHRGIHLAQGDGVPRACNLGCGEDPLGPVAEATELVPAVSAACLLVRRDAFEAAGGFDDRYRYGTEDVDLCLRLRELGETIVYEGRSALWHHEYGTQNAEGRDRKRGNRIVNRERFVNRWGARVFREVLADRLAGIHAWSKEPLHVAVTLTQDDPEAGWGDFYTAHELGNAFAALGWKVSYAERYRDRWYELDPTVDVLVVLLDAYELPRAPAGTVTVAWVRNWTDRWLSHPWFDDYDVVIASSRRSQELIQERSSKDAHLLPLATNPARFRPVTPCTDLDTDVVFIGNYWGQHRGVVDALPPLASDGCGVRVYGLSWEDLPSFGPIHGGPLPYERLPEAYSSARVVIDDTAGPTKPYAAVNSRLFDALAAGAFVVTDNEAGVHDLFDDEFPIWSDGPSLKQHVERHLADPTAGRALAERYRRIVLAEHTYERRASQIRDLLLEWCLAERIDVRVGIPDRVQAERWGDYHFARALQRQMERRGRPTCVTLLPDWNMAKAARADVVVHLFGLSEFEPRPGQVNVLWVISHPELVTIELCERYDLVLVASDAHAEQLARAVSVPVVCLHQATDPDRFHPAAPGPAHDLLFVGNSRRTRRRIVDDLSHSGVDFAVYGADWTPDLVDPARVRSDHVPNADVAGYYANAEIVLNDHWDGMRAHGFYSNRLYDALAAGTVVVSDHVAGVEEHFDGGVVTYRNREELGQLVQRLLDDPRERCARAERGRKAVLAEHTFAHRAERILELLTPILAARRLRIDESGPPGRRARAADANAAVVPAEAPAS